MTCSCNPHKSFISSHLDKSDNILDKYSESYENLAFMGEFNISMDDKFMTNFYELNDLSSLIGKPTSC